MSRWVSRIRDCFQDPLLVRTKNKMILTPVAETILSQLDRLEPLLRSLMPKEFDPESSQIEFSIAAPDYVIENVVTDILSELLQKKYQVSFRFLPWTPFSKKELLKGNVHLAISLDNVFPPNVYRRTIDEDYLVCIARKGHPISQKGIVRFEDLLEYSHVIPETGGGWVKRMRNKYERHGRFKPKVFTSSYNAAFAIAGATDLITIAPSHVVRYSSILETLSIHKFPLSETKLEYGFFWHEKYQTDPSHVWLRKKMFPLFCAHKKQLASLQ